ncbi:hypothetical protein FBU30_005286 [Linnemannia zychae]|nr:hypothetical protein FBU30_005286 [Linnemannia zychae]
MEGTEVATDRTEASTIIRNFLQSRPCDVDSPSPMSASTVRAVSLITVSEEDTEQLGLDDSRSDQPVKWRLKSQYTHVKMPTSNQNPFLRTPTKRTIQTKAPECPETGFALSEKFNQDTTFVCKGIYIVKLFQEYRSKDSDSFSLTRDWIADFSSGSQFEQAPPAHLKPALNLNMNEREAFISFAWTFIRGAFTLTNIETRSLEVLITGVEERKNHGLDLRLETKQAGKFADGTGFSGANQIYLAEAVLLHEPKPEKLKEDEYKLVRAMRDSWTSQLKAICREYIPCRAMTVFGSSSYMDETKVWLLDFKGVFRLFHFDSFLSRILEDE